MKSTEPKCCLTLTINMKHLVFPDKMNEIGKEYIKARGIDHQKLGDLIAGAEDLGNGDVKLQHRCSQLLEDGRCALYGEKWPQLCREYICDDKECDFCERYEKRRVQVSDQIDLSIVIPSRNEMFLARTIDDIMENMEASTEIIAVCDGAWPDPPVLQRNQVNVIYVPEAIGQRAATNIGARLAQGKYIMKIDAHCSFDKGFDRIMLEGFKEVGDDVTMVPIMRNLWAFDWKCHRCGWKRYQGPTPEQCGNPECAEKHPPKIRRKMMWVGKHNPQSWSYCFDAEPHFQYFEHYKHRPGIRENAKATGFSETMSLQGSCFMATKEKYWELDLGGESLGSWGNQGLQTACATWLSGGRVLVNHRTWYAHLFRTQGSDFGFPYPQGGREVSRTKQRVKKLFWEMKHPKQIYPVSWLVKKFWPVNGWSDEDLARLLEFEATLPNQRTEELGVLSVVPPVPGPVADHTPPMAVNGIGQ